MFRLHTLTVYLLRKVRYLINRIVIDKEQEEYYLQKNASFDILSLANKLHKSKSTHLQGLKHGQNYFLEHQVLELITMGLKHLPKAVGAYKKIVKKNIVNVKDKTAAILDDTVANKAVDDLFRQVQEDNAVISEFYNE